MNSRFGLPALIAILLFICTPTVFAGWQEGQDANKRKDYSAAVKEWTPLAEQGHIDAQLGLGDIYFFWQKYQESLYWYKKAADNGSVPAQEAVAFQYSVGWGVPVNDKLAFFWYKKAAENGGKCIGIANSYRNGNGVKQDYKQAIFWYEKDAKRGDINAYISLGRMYGKDELANHNKAIYWLTKAAEKGSSDAAFHLGEEFFQHKEYKQARIWYEKTVKMNDDVFTDFARVKLVEIEGEQPR